jgi:hypothetical protein
VEKIYAFCGNVFTGRTQKALDGYVSFPHGARSSLQREPFAGLKASLVSKAVSNEQ